MKKIVSLTLVLAMLLTFAVTPAYADSITKPDATVTLSYVTNLPEGTTEVHPGDEFNLTIKATASEEVTIDGYDIKVGYNDNAYTIDNNGNDNVSLKETKSGDKFIFIVKAENGDDAITISTTGTEIATVKVTVKESVADATSTTFDKLNVTHYGSEFTIADENTGTTGTEFASTTTNLTYKVNTATITVNNEAYTQDKLYTNAEGVSFTVTGTNITSVTYKEASASDSTSVDVTDKKTATATINTAGTYTVTVNMTGQTQTFTFRVSTETVNAQIGINFTHNETGYKAGDTVFVPVKISGIGDDKNGMISFDVDYDADKLTLDATGDANTTYTEKTGEGTKYTVAYGTAETGVDLTNGADFVTLAFTVKSDAAIGDTAVTIKNQQVTIKANNTIVTDNDSSQIDLGTANIVIVPETYATITNTEVTDWTKTDYTIAVTPTNGVSYRWATVTNEYTSQEAMATLWNSISSEDQQNTAVSVTESGAKYIVIAAIGTSKTIYNVVATLVPGTDIWLDKTAPEINETGLTGMSAFAKSYTLSTAGIGSDKVGSLDNLGTFKGLKYIVVGSDADAPTDSTDGWNAVSDDSISIATSTVGKLYLMAEDKAGNTTVSTNGLDIKVDTDDPTVTATAGTENNEGLPITISAGDTTSNVTVNVYNSATAIDSPNAESFTSMSPVATYPDEDAATVDASYIAKADGYYYVVASDEAGNTTVSDVVHVTLAQIQDPSAISVKVGAELNYKDSVFFENIGDNVIKDFGYSNGTFGYVAIKVAAPTSSEYTNTITATKNSETYDITDGANIEAEKEFVFNTAGTYEVTVTTTHKTATSKSATKTYKFTIAADQEGMISPSGDSQYNIYDFTMIKKVVKAQALNGIPTTDYGFSGIYAGDLNGDFTTDAEDLNAIITSIKAANIPGYYDFAIMNGTAAPTTTSVGE